MNFLTPRSKWMDDIFSDWNPGYFIRPLHGEGLPSDIRINLREGDEFYTVEADLPGVSKEDIDVQLKDSVVSISAEIKQHDQQTKDDKVLRSERYFGQVSRSFQLPTDVEVEHCEAKFKDGVLTLKLPKAVHEESRQKIKIS